MVFGVFWHGEKWTLVVWGGIHGFAFFLNKKYINIPIKIIIPPPPPPRIYRNVSRFLCFMISNIFTNLFVCFCWIFFRADSFTTAWQIIKRIILWEDGIIQIYVWFIFAMIIVIIATLITSLKALEDKSKEINGFYPLLNLSKIWHLTIFFMVIGIIFGIAYTGTNPFIYFQF
jgi:alginate O-acetyltransferase complex protein AlgI